MKYLVTCAFVLGLISSLSQPALAGEMVQIAYPTAEEASFVITAPDDWELDPAEEVGGYFDLQGPTGAIFSFRTIKGTEEALEKAIDESIKDLAEDFTDIELGEVQDWKPNGLTGFFLAGTAKDKEDGTKGRVGLGWCVLADGRIAELWFYALDTDKAGIAVAEKIANSLKAP